MSCRQLCPNTWNVFKGRAVRSELTNCLGAAFASKQKLLQLAILLLMTGKSGRVQLIHHR